MRKVILLLALLTVSNVLLYSQKEDIIPIEVIEIKKPNTKGNHVPAKIQVECCYYSYLNNLELSFMSNVGIVTVCLEKSGYRRNPRLCWEQLFWKDVDSSRIRYRIPNGHCDRKWS